MSEVQSVPAPQTQPAAEAALPGPALALALRRYGGVVVGQVLRQDPTRVPPAPTRSVVTHEGLAVIVAEVPALTTEVLSVQGSDPDRRADFFSVHTTEPAGAETLISRIKAAVAEVNRQFPSAAAAAPAEPNVVGDAGDPLRLKVVVVDELLVISFVHQHDGLRASSGVNQRALGWVGDFAIHTSDRPYLSDGGLYVLGANRQADVKNVTYTFPNAEQANQVAEKIRAAALDVNRRNQNLRSGPPANGGVELPAELAGFELVV